MYLCGRKGGWFMQQYIVRLLREGTLRVHTATQAELSRSLDLMEQYQDRPMDLADASLVALAEARGYGRVFSIDSDFYVYRLADGSALEVVPGPMPQQRGR
jgi:predicted nucleic acid-binding protein